MKNDGNIRIGIKITDVDSKIKTIDRKIESLNGKLSNLGEKKLPLQRQLDEINKRMLENEQEYMDFQNMIKDGQLSASEFKKLGGTEGIQKNLTSLESANDRLNTKAQALEQKIKDIELSEKNVNLQLDEQRNKREDLVQKQQQLNVSQAEQGTQLNGIGNKVKDITKKVVKWSLAVFSIRSAYMFVRQAMGTLTQYNKQMGTDVEYIRYALANMLKPIVEWIINAVYKILTYINYIANAWFGVNLFKDAGADKFAKDMNSASESAKEIKKELAGFDVANVMSEQSSKSAKTSGTGIPSLDLSKVKQIDVPDWVKWIADHKDLIIGLAEVVGIAWGTAKVAGILGNIAKVFGFATGGVGGSGLLGLASSLSTIATLASIAIIITVASQVWNDLDAIEKQMVRINDEQRQYNIGWTNSIEPTADVGELTNKIGANITNGRKQMEKANTTWVKWRGNSKEYLKVAKNVALNTEANAKKADEMWKAEGRTVEEKKKLLTKLKEQYTYNLEVIAQLENQGMKTDDVRKANEDLKKQIEGYNDELKKSPDYVEEQEGSWDKVNGKVDEMKDIAKGAYDYLHKISLEKIGDKTFIIKGQTKIDTAGISKMIDQAMLIGSGLVGRFDPSMWNNIKKGITNWRNKLGLDSGGLVLPQPGHGVPIGSGAVMSERRAEAIIPFENPEAMRKIGKEIGQWVNLAIENKMVVDGQVLATATNNAMNKADFLMNR